MKLFALALIIAASPYGMGAAHASQIECADDLASIKRVVAGYAELTKVTSVLNANKLEAYLRQGLGERFEPSCLSDLSSLKDIIDIEPIAKGFTLYKWEPGHRYGFTITSDGRVRDVYVIFK